MESVSTDTVIVGGSAAGLSVAACLKRAGVPFVLLEQSDQVASVWRRHYDRLHLHTSKGLSSLPFKPMPKSYPRYPSRDEVVKYMENYAKEFSIDPVFGTKVDSIERDLAGQWVTKSGDRSWTSKHVVLATGYARKPFVPSWPGMEEFEGEVLHSSNFKNGVDLNGQRVLVVGFGNSAGEIALDLAENGAQTELSVRGPVNAVPRDLLGIPILGWGIALGILPMKLADLVGLPLIWAAVGDIRKLGLKKLPYGPNTQTRGHGRIPLLDIGTIKKIRQGEIAVRPGIERFNRSGVVFADGKEASFDKVILGTGYRPALSEFLKTPEGAIDESGMPTSSGQEIGNCGLYLCGFFVSPTGMLREIAIEAKNISNSIKQHG